MYSDVTVIIKIFVLYNVKILYIRTYWLPISIFEYQF